MARRALCLALLTLGCQRTAPSPTPASPASATASPTFTAQSACAAALPKIAAQPPKAQLDALGAACQWSSAEIEIARRAQRAPDDLEGLAALLLKAPLEEACPGAIRLLSTLGPNIDARPAIIKRCGLVGLKPSTPAARLMATGILAHALRTRGVADPIGALSTPLGLTR